MAVKKQKGDAEHMTTPDHKAMEMSEGQMPVARGKTPKTVDGKAMDMVPATKGSGTQGHPAKPAQPAVMRFLER